MKESGLVKVFGLVVDYIGVAKDLEKALWQFEGDFINEAKRIIRSPGVSEEEFEKRVRELKEDLQGIEMGSIEDVDRAVETLVLNNKEKEFTEKAKKLLILSELLPSDAVLKYIEFCKWISCVLVALNRYRRIGMRLEEIEKMARKTYDLIQKTVGVENIEKIGEVKIAEELSKLEIGKEPIVGIRVLGEIERRIAGLRSDFYVSLREEIEKIVEEMRRERRLTRDIIEKIRSVQRKLEERQAEKERLKEIFPVFDVLRNRVNTHNTQKAQRVSEEIVQELKEKDLLGKESFLKAGLRKEVMRIVREGIIRNFGLLDEMDEIVGSIYTNLEEEYA